MTAATRADTDEMAGAITYFLYGQGPASFVHRLPPDDLDLISTTAITVRDHASAADLRVVGVPKGSLLLGLYTFPPAHIQVFADGVLATGHDPVDVFQHEMGHRFGFDHSTHPVATALYVPAGGSISCTSFHPELTQPTGWHADPPSPEAVDDDACPFCRLHNRTAEVMALSEGLRRRAWLAAQPTLIPVGLGGTIPLMRRKLTEAHEALLEAATLFPDRTGEVRDLDRLLHATQERLEGHLTTEEVTPVAQAAQAAWDAAYSLTHSYVLHTRYPGVDIHDLA